MSSLFYRDISWHGNLICHLQASFILKNITLGAVKKQFNNLPYCNSRSEYVCCSNLSAWCALDCSKHQTPALKGWICSQYDWFIAGMIC